MPQSFETPARWPTWKCLLIALAVFVFSPVLLAILPIFLISVTFLSPVIVPLLIGGYACGLFQRSSVPQQKLPESQAISELDSLLSPGKSGHVHAREGDPVEGNLALKRLRQDAGGSQVSNTNVEGRYSKEDPATLADNLMEETYRAAKLEASEEWKTPEKVAPQPDLTRPSIEKSNPYKPLEGAPQNGAEIEEEVKSVTSDKASPKEDTPNKFIDRAIQNIAKAFAGHKST